MIELLTMNHYGIYVWPAYGITLLILVCIVFLVLREKNKTHRILKHYIENKNES